MKLRQPLNKKYTKMIKNISRMKNFFEYLYSRGVYAYEGKPDMQFTVLHEDREQTEEERKQRMAPPMRLRVDVKLPGKLTLDDVIVRVGSVDAKPFYIAKDFEQ